MDIQDQDATARWEALGSRDARSRGTAMEHISQEVMRRVESIGPIPATIPSPLATAGHPTSDLNDILARLLMLSKRCPFDDVRERCVWLLQNVQVGEHSSRGRQMWCCLILHGSGCTTTTEFLIPEVQHCEQGWSLLFCHPRQDSKKCRTRISPIS